MTSVREMDDAELLRWLRSLDVKPVKSAWEKKDGGILIREYMRRHPEKDYAEVMSDVRQSR